MDISFVPQNTGLVDIALGSDKADATQPLKQKKKSMTSLYLKFFDTAPDGKTRSCKFCQQTYSMATATGNLGRHLNHRHPGYDHQQGDIMQQSWQASSFVPNKKPHSHPKCSSLDIDNLNWLLLKWVLDGSFSLSVFEDEALLNCFKFLNPLAQFWSKERAQTIILEVFRSICEDVKASLEHVNSKISITLDFWTNYEQICYLAVTAHWVDECWVTHKLLLDVSHVPYGGIEMDRTILKILKIFNIENRILSCTHDNSPSAIIACQKLKDDLDGLKIPFFLMPCAAHALQRIIEDGLKSAKSVLARVREFVLEMNASLEITKDFRQIAATYLEGTWKIPLDASTRWSGEYTMLNLVRKACSAIDAVVCKHGDVLDGRNMLLSSSEKNALSIIHAFLEPFYKTTSNLCASKSTTIGLVLFFMDHVIEMITSCCEGRATPDWLRGAAEDMSKTARVFSSQVNNLYTYMTAVLDPRIKGELLPEMLNTDHNLEEARNHFMKIYFTTHFPLTTNGYANIFHEGEERGSVSFVEEIARKRRRSSISSAMDELTQYLSEPPAPIATDVMDWWKANNTRYPRLSVMARDYLSVQATSVPPEEIFSSKADEVDRQRICLPHSNTEVILCLRSWLRSGFKLKCYSNAIDCEKLLQFATAALDRC